MGITPDRQAGPREEEELQLTDEGVDPSVVGALVQKAGAILAKDSLGIFNIRGISEVQHAALRQLVHLADGVGGPMEEWASGSFREVLPANNPFPTSVIWYTDNTKTKKIVAKLITFDGQKRVTQVQWGAYQSDGVTVIVTVTDTLTYSGSNPFEINRTRTVT